MVCCSFLLLHALQSPCGPVIREGRVEVHRSGKTFKTPLWRDWPSAHRVNRSYSGSRWGHPTCRALRLCGIFVFLEESEVFVGRAEGRLAWSTTGKCLKQSSHVFCIASAGFYSCFRRRSSPVSAHSCAHPVVDQTEWVTLGCAISGWKNAMSGAETM